MIKRNNKGFTLLELLISIFILTIVIFVGYRVINKSTIDIKNQGNINKGQLTINDMNKYLTKDLKQASSIVLFVGDKKIIDTSIEEQETLLTNGKLEEELTPYLTDIENSSLKDDKVTYSYNIRFKEDEESENTYSIIYSVEIIKDKNNYKYSVLRKKIDGISISFITNEVLKEEELPFTIEGNSLYVVTLGYNGKNNEFEKHEFTVYSRLHEISNVSDDEDSVNSGNSNNYLWYCLEMAKKSFQEAYKSVSDENIKNNLINIITPIIDISKTNPLDNDKYNEISGKIKILNDNIEKLLGSSEGCLSSEDRYKVVEILKKGKNYLDVAQKTIEVSPDGKLPDPPNNDIWVENVKALSESIENEIYNKIKSRQSNVKAALENNAKYTLQYKSLDYMEKIEYPKLDVYIQNQIYAIIKDKILHEHIKVDSESNRNEYNQNLYTCIDNINRMIESIIHIQFELEKIIKVLDDDVEYTKNESIKCVNELTLVNEGLVIIKGYLEQATYKDEKIEIYEDIFGEHSH